ncbi:hypothetical protein ACFOGJ_23135 [Marinibaculum pumilum]|uniref:Translation initiation factor IF-2 n=1 Tax=Marinibaculum pumilum TaxID=1766165 RepID=A0ABV7L682_9PROT
MRIPRLLEVLGRKGGRAGERAAPGSRADSASPAGRGVPPEPYAPEARTGGGSPKVYVEEVRVRTGRFDAQEAPPPGFRGTRTEAARPPAAPPGDVGGRPPRRAERERITVSAEIEGGGQALRRPPAGRR